MDVSGGHRACAEGLRASGSDLLKDLAKKRRKLEREHGPAVFTAMSAASSDFETLIEWKRRQYRATRQTDIFEAGWPLALLRQLFETRDPCFGGALFTLHAGDRLVAAHFALRGWRVLHAWFIAHDEDYGRYSPGLLLFDDILRWMDGGPHVRLDLGPGGYGFKRRFANVEQPVGHGFVGLPSAATLVRSAQYGLRGAVEALPLPAVSALPGKAMRRMDLIRALR